MAVWLVLLLGVPVVLVDGFAAPWGQGGLEQAPGRCAPEAGGGGCRGLGGLALARPLARCFDAHAAGPWARRPLSRVGMSAQPESGEKNGSAGKESASGKAWRDEPAGGAAEGGAVPAGLSLGGVAWGPVLLLNAVTVLWGSQHTVIKMAVDADAGGSPASLNLARFLISALVFLPFTSLMRTDSAQQGHANAQPDTEPVGSDGRGNQSGLAAEQGQGGVLMAGAELGLWMFAGYAAQSVGLLYTTASRSAFLLYLNVKLVPVFSSLLYGAKISAATWIAAAVALCGTALLGYDGSPPNIGDVWSIAAAAASALFIIRRKFSNEYDAKDLNAASLAVVSVLCLVWALVVDQPASLQDLLPTSDTQMAAALYLGLVCTAFTNFIQTLGQKEVPAERAAIIYAMDPVYGAAFAYAFLGERLGVQGLVGCVLLFLATVVSNRASPPEEGGG